jgi:hypothetical protein
MRDSMATNIRHLAGGLAAILALFAPGFARGEVVDVSSSTMLIVRDQARAGILYPVAPLYEILSMSARDIRNPVAEDLQLVVSTWGAASIGSNLVWYDNSPPEHRLFGDLDLAYLQGEILKRSVQLRVGRQLVAGGVTGSIQLDGANALVRLPLGFGISAYAGSPVSQRFGARGSETTWNPQRGNLAFGGRGYWTLPSWAEVGLSVVDVEDRGDPSRRQVGADLRFTPLRLLTFLANSAYDLYESRWAETNVAGQYQLLPKLLVGADYRHVEPDLFLPRDSILAVFAAEQRNEVGGSVQYDPLKTVTVIVDYHYLMEQDDGVGHRANGRVTWRPAFATTLGAEIGLYQLYNKPSGSYLNNGYFQARAFGSKQIGRLSGTLDLQEYAFQQTINGQQNSFIATATLGYVIGHGFAALVSGSGGATPYYERRFDFMAKIAYNQSYQLREVR